MKQVIEKLASDIEQEMKNIQEHIEKYTFVLAVAKERHAALLEVLESMSMLEGIVKYKRKNETTNRRSRKDCCDDRQPAGSSCVPGGENESECSPQLVQSAE